MVVERGEGPEVVVEVRDPIDGIRGVLVIDRLVRGIAAGGLRIARNVDREELTALAAAMTRKQAAYGIAIGGAKAGLAMDPNHPRRAAILRRFLTVLRPVIAAMWSVGPDVNTSMDELESCAREVGLPSLKICVPRSRGLDEATFLRRYALFDADVGGWSVNQLRGPAAVKAATLALLAHLGVAAEGARIAIQGAGTMGGGAAHLLHSAGCTIVGWADARRSLLDPAGLDVPEFLARRDRGHLPAAGGERPTRALLEVDCDVLVLAAISDAVSPTAAATLACRGIVEAANLAVAPPVAAAIHARGITVVPDVVASAGGSLAVEALYSGDPRRGEDVLAHVERRAGVAIAALLEESAAAGVALRELVRAAPPPGRGGA
jgi:glutamate dehydrogenase (NAD(P)+)